MIFKIADGRECFYQWDIDRQLIVSDPTITEVHFCNRIDVCSLVVEVVDGVANVPNKLLQSGFGVRVFGYDGKATMHEATFEVKARTQPADYVYTETVVKSIDEILEAAETVTTTANEFYEFVEDHTLGFTDDGKGNVELVAVDAEESVDLTDYYTKTEVNELIENIDIPETDLTGYATETYVNEAIANIDIPKVDLESYAKKTDIPDVSNFISEIPSEYVTETELAAKGYATKTELNDKADANHTHTGYAKSTHTHSTADVDGLQKALNEKATQADIDKAIELHDHRYDYAPIEHSHGDEYAAKTHTHSYNDLLDKPTIPSVEGLATEKYVDDAIANIEITGGGGGGGKPLYQHTVYLTSNATSTADSFKAPSFYATFVCGRAEAFTFASFADYLYSTGSKLAVSGTLRYAGYYSASPAPIDSVYAVSKTELRLVHRKTSEDADEIAEISVNSSNLSSFTDTIVLIGSASVVEGGDVDLSNYYTKAEVNNLIPDTSSFITEVPAEYITETELNNKGYLTEHQSLDNYYTKEETTQAIQDALNAIGVAEGGAY